MEEINLKQLFAYELGIKSAPLVAAAYTIPLSVCNECKFIGYAKLLSSHQALFLRRF